MRLYRVALPHPNMGWSQSNLVTLKEAIRMLNSWKSMGYKEIKIIDTTITKEKK